MRIAAAVTAMSAATTHAEMKLRIGTSEIHNATKPFPRSEVWGVTSRQGAFVHPIHVQQTLRKQPRVGLLHAGVV